MVSVTRYIVRLRAPVRLGRCILAAVAVVCGAVLAGGVGVAGAAAPVATWTRVAPAASPSGRFKAAMAYDQATKQLVLFGGGVSGGGVLGDTWTWTGANWTRSRCPARRRRRALAREWRTTSRAGS